MNKLIRRPWGVFYLKNKITGQQTSLKSSDKLEAQRILYPERFAMENLGPNSKAVHRAYAKRAQTKISSLKEFKLQNAEALKAEIECVAGVFADGHRADG